MKKYDQLKATTFAVLIGTGGCFVPVAFVATNGGPPVQAIRPVEPNVSAAKLVSSKVAQLETEYCLGRDQLANLLGVSRPTIYSWLSGKAQGVRNANQERVGLISGWLDENVTAEFRPYLGKLLRRTLDPQVQEISNQLSAPALDVRRLGTLVSLLNFKLEGIEQVEVLDRLLADKKSLI